MIIQIYKSAVEIDKYRLTMVLIKQKPCNTGDTSVSEQTGFPVVFFTDPGACTLCSLWWFEWKMSLSLSISLYCSQCLNLSGSCPSVSVKQASQAGHRLCPKG